MIYEIDKNNLLKIWVNQGSFDEAEPPMLIQPDYPNGDSWTNKQATAWAEQFILSQSDPSADLPGMSAAEPIQVRPADDRPPVPEMSAASFDDFVAAKAAELLAASKETTPAE
tara:strand:- start:297 stop:635 length:339 start_codon:yes stop_codon:yes gene_type:complete